MNLIWHLAKKDLRRMVLPVALWLAFLGLPALWLARVHVPEEVVLGDAVMSWSNVIGALLTTVSLMQVVAGAMLAGFLVLEDPAECTSALWMTRPITGWRLLAAKLLTAALLFVAAPVSVLLPAWLAAGFTMRDCAAAATDWTLAQGGMVLAALALASLAQNLTHYVTVLLGFVLVMGISMSRLPAQWLGVEVAFNGSLQFLFGALVLPLLAVVLVLQYQTRDARRGWTVVGLILVVAFAARIYWHVERGPQVPAVTGVALELPLRAGAEVRAGGSLLRVAGFTLSGRGMVSALILEERGRGSGFLRPRRSGGLSPCPFFLRENLEGVKRRLRANPTIEVAQLTIMLRVWRLVPEDDHEWPVTAVIVTKDGPEADKIP